MHLSPPACTHNLIKSLTSATLYRMDVETLACDAAVRIRDDILAGRLRAGDRLKLADLGRRYGLGLTPVREALRELQGERLVEIVPNCGASVRRLDRAAVDDIFEVRMALEGMTARRAARVATPAAIAELHEVHERLVRHVATSEHRAALEANRDFHRAIAIAGGNGEALAVLERQWRIIPALWKAVDYAPSRLPQVIADHVQLLEALIAGDADGAEAIAVAHVAKARRELLARWPEGEAVRNA